MTEPTTFSIEDARFEAIGDLDGVRTKALIVGAIGALATIAGYFVIDHDVFFRSLLVGWVYWLGIALGLFYICLMVHVSGGRWGIQMRRVHEASGRSLWLFALIAIPLFGLGMHELYSWTHASAATDALVQAKANYLKLWFDSGDGNGLTWYEMIVPGFYPRLMLTFALWLGWAFKLTQLSERYDETGDDKYRIQQMRWAAAGLLVCVMLATFGSIDWLMSTDPHWFSSLYGPQMLDWQMLSALAFSIPLLIFFSIAGHSIASSAVRTFMITAS